MRMDDDASSESFAASPTAVMSEKLVAYSPVAFAGDAKGLSGRLCSKLQYPLLHILQQNL